MTHTVTVAEQAISFVKLNNWGNHVTGFHLQIFLKRQEGAYGCPVLSLILFDMDALTLRGTLEGTHQRMDGWMSAWMDGWMIRCWLGWKRIVTNSSSYY
jgi:hypothetical protein